MKGFIWNSPPRRKDFLAPPTLAGLNVVMLSKANRRSSGETLMVNAAGISHFARNDIFPGKAGRATFLHILCALCVSAVNLFAQPGALHAQHLAPNASRAWSPNQRVFDDLGISVQSEPAIATNGGQVLIAWTDERNTQPDIYANVSSGNTIAQANIRVTDEREHGVTFDNAPDTYIEANGRAFAVYSTQDDIVLARREVGDTEWLSRTLMSVGNETWYGDARRPSIGVNGNTAVVIWQDYRNRQWDIYSARCNLDAMTCAANIKVSDATDTSWQIKPRIAVVDNNALAVWEDYREGESIPHVYASTSGDGGATWGANGRIDAGDNPGTAPAVSYGSDGAAWITWEKHANGDVHASADIYAASWNGTVWAQQPRVDGAPAGKRALNPRVSVGPAGVFVVWEDYRSSGITPRIYSARFNATGWNEVLLDGVQTGSQTRPAISKSGTADVRVAWQDTRNGQPDVYAARWNGSAWADVAQVNENASRMAKQYYPNLSPVGNGDVYLSWLDTRDYDIKPYISRYLYTASQWGAPIAVPVNGAGRYDVLQDQVASALDSAGRLHVLWTQGSDLGVQIFHSQFDGKTWSGVIQASDTTTSTIYRPRQEPALAIRGSKIAATWIEWDTSQSWPLPTRIFAATFDGEKWNQSIVSQGVIRGDPRPSIALDDAGNLYIAWSDMRWDGAGIKADIVVSKQAAAGGPWSTPLRVNTTAATLNYCINERPQLKSVGSVLHITWAACVPWTDNVFYSNSSNGGATWATAQRISIVGDNAVHPALALGPGEVNLIYASKTTDGILKFYGAELRGGSWVTDTQISDGPSAWVRDDDGPPSIIYDPVSNGYVAAWVDHRIRDLPQIYVSRTGSSFVPTNVVFMPLARK